MNDLASFKKKVGIGALIIVLMHILLAVFTVLIPQDRIKSNIVASFYNQLVLLGPFFQESRIKASPHLFVSYKRKDVWNPYRDYASENFLIYKQNLWNYYRLHKSDFQRYIANEVGQQKMKGFDEVIKSRGFRELNQHITGELIGEPVDSLKLLYGVNTYFPDSKTSRFDTIFYYTYNPNQVAGFKN